FTPSPDGSGSPGGSRLTCAVELTAVSWLKSSTCSPRVTSLIAVLLLIRFSGYPYQNPRKNLPRYRCSREFNRAGTFAGRASAGCGGAWLFTCTSIRPIEIWLRRRESAGPGCRKFCVWIDGRTCELRISLAGFSVAGFLLPRSAASSPCKLVVV